MSEMRSGEASRRREEVGWKIDTSVSLIFSSAQYACRQRANVPSLLADEGRSMGAERLSCGPSCGPSCGS